MRIRTVLVNVKLEMPGLITVAESKHKVEYMHIYGSKKADILRLWDLCGIHRSEFFRRSLLPGASKQKYRRQRSLWRS